MPRVSCRACHAARTGPARFVHGAGTIQEHEYEKAIETLKSFEKKNEKLLALAATNLSFLYYPYSRMRARR
jgi:lipopolysaccharide biosynthesis regulator YciM